MAKIDDIDTQASVRKYLERRVVVDRENEEADTADEIQAILESTAIAFLLFPQAALLFVIRAKNTLQQVVARDIELITYLEKAVADVDNPNVAVTDTSDLVEAQTALVEVDRIGRISNEVRAFERYNAAINRFLDKQLAKSLKRRRLGEFERTGAEARQDMFRALPVFGSVHGLMASRIETLVASVSDFQSVDLTRIVATKTVARVRASLQRILNGITRRNLSKTVAAVELLSGAAALQSVSATRDVYDPLIDSGSYPTGRSIYASSEPASATALGGAGTKDLNALTSWVFSFTVDGGTTYNIDLPYSGARGRAYVKGTTSGPFNIPADNRTLYLQLDGLTPPAYQPTTVKTVTLPTGSSVSVSDVISAVNAVLGADGTCVEMAPGSGRLLIYGSSSVTRIVVLSGVAGTFDGSGNYVEAAGSAHSILGFSDEQESPDIGLFSPDDLVDFIQSRVSTVTTVVVDDKPQITSNSTEVTSSLLFSGNVATEFGFSSSIYEANPSYLTLQENGADLDAASLGVSVDSLFVVADALSPDRDLFAQVTQIDGSKIYFDVPVPRCQGSHAVRVLSPAVYSVQSLLQKITPYVGTFSEDARTLQQVLTPLLSKPSLAQINDALRALQDIRTRVEALQTALSSIVLKEGDLETSAVAQNIVASLEERGLDRALDLLKTGHFSAFFGLTKEVASRSTRFLKAMEEVGRKDFPTSTDEDEAEGDRLRGTTPDDSVLPDTEIENEVF